MRRSLLSFAVAGLSLTCVSGYAQLPSSSFSINVIPRGTFPVYQVYPVSPLSYNNTNGNPDQIRDNTCFVGQSQIGPNVTVTPGVLCLGTNNFRLNVNAFARCPSGFSNAFVQSARLIKTVPGSQKAPFCYDFRQYVQFGTSGIRTWWALKYTQPGTTFCLELTTLCFRQGTRMRVPTIHVDKYTWVVDAQPETLPMVIDMLHSSALSTLEFPCIADEGVYRDLQFWAGALIAAAGPPTTFPNPRVPLDPDAAVIAIRALEAIVFGECVFADFVAPVECRIDNPSLGLSKIPGNFPSGTDWTQFPGPFEPIDGGILDSFENPCCCKLIADIEYIAIKLGVAIPPDPGQGPGQM